MTTIYLISNNCFLTDNIIYKDYIDLDEKRKNRPLSVNGEKVALTITKNKKVQNVESIYSSSFLSAINSAKYLTEKLNLDLIIDKRLDDRVVGDLQNQNLNLRTLQEHDFDYRLPGGESLNEVKSRMTEIVKEILNNHKDSSIALYTHNISIISLLSIWCEKGFNYDEKLILNYDEEVIIDGLKNDYNLVEMTFDDEKLECIKKIV